MSSSLKTTVSNRERKKDPPLPVSNIRFADIPEDIISDILIPLPAKTLIPFRYVSKSWRYLISNLEFIKTHLSKSYISNHRRLILNHCDPSLGFYSVESYSLNFNNKNTVKLDYPTIDSLSHVSMVGSCNGLVCIHIAEFGTFFWNPYNGKSKELPVWNIQLGPLLFTSYGFGYDQTNDDDKVVRIIASHDFEGEKEVKLYSLKTNLWRSIENLSLGNPSGDWGKYVNGVLHWKVVGNDNSMVIVSLNLEKETYDEIA